MYITILAGIGKNSINNCTYTEGKGSIFWSLSKCKTLNLEEDEVVLPAVDGMKQDADSQQVTSNRIQMKNMNPLVQAKGRPH